MTLFVINPALLLPLARVYQALCEQFPVVAQLTQRAGLTAGTSAEPLRARAD